MMPIVELNGSRLCSVVFNTSGFQTLDLRLPDIATAFTTTISVH